MNNILRHTLATSAAKKAAGYASSPLRRMASALRPLGVAVDGAR